MARSYSIDFHFGLLDRSFEDALLWQKAGRAGIRLANVFLPSWSWASVNGAIKYTFKEERITDLTSAKLPAYWQEGAEPSVFSVDWFISLDGSDVITINNAPLRAAINPPPRERPPRPMYQLALQRPGRLPFYTQYTYMNLRNSLPHTTQDSWWTDYTTDVDLNAISMISIRLPGTEPNSLAGFIEMDKLWAEQNLRPENEQSKWEFIAISLATSRMDDFMHVYLTQLRNTNYPLV
jgi:hypothetical protein